MSKHDEARRVAAKGCGDEDERTVLLFLSGATDDGRMRARDKAANAFDRLRDRLAKERERADRAEQLVRDYEALPWSRDAALAQNAELRAALRGYATHVDEMSYHGEAMVCDLCGSWWNNGAKRNEAATPETHSPSCLLATEPPRRAPDGWPTAEAIKDIADAHRGSDTPR